MDTVVKEFRDHIAIVRMNSGTMNPINATLVDELSRTLSEIKGSARGLVLCGGEKFFSAGLALPELLKLDRPAMADFFERFNQLCLDLFSLPYPTIALLSGHAVAGGNILALACDYRYASSEAKKIGLNELKLGVPVPYLADLMLRHTIGDRYATQMIFSAEFITFAEAKIIGLIDVTGSPDELEDFTLDRLNRIAGYDSDAFAAAKANKVDAVRRKYAKHGPSRNDTFIDCWFSDATQKKLFDAALKF